MRHDEMADPRLHQAYTAIVKSPDVMRSAVRLAELEMLGFTADEEIFQEAQSDLDEALDKCFKQYKFEAQPVELLHIIRDSCRRQTIPVQAVA